MVATVPKDEPTSDRKSRKKGEKKLKRLCQEAEQPEKLVEGSVSKPASSAPEGGMGGMPLVSAHESTMPPSAIPSVANVESSRQDIGPVFEPVQVKPVLDCSEYAAETHELWLLQLPMDLRSRRGPQQQLPVQWRLEEEATISTRKLPGGACAGRYVDARGNCFDLREEDASLAAPVYIANASHQGINLRCSRRMTVARDHSAKLKAEVADREQQVAPATPVAASKKKRKALQAETPSKAIGPDTGVQLQLDDILAAEASPTGKQGTPADATPWEKKKKRQKKG